MLSLNTIRVLNFDNSIIEQTRFLEVFNKSRLKCEVIDFLKEGVSLRYYATNKDYNVFTQRLPLQCGNAVTFYGSGDFHHISASLIESFPKPISVIVFDHHPDWDARSAYLSCGSWVTRIERLSHVKKVVLLGPSADDLGFGLMNASLWGLNSNKLEIYPYNRVPSTIYFRKLVSNNSLTLKKHGVSTKITWHNLINENLSGFLTNVLQNIPTQDVYVSIDKDCLGLEDAVTNWEQGKINIDWLINALSLIVQKKNVIGLDVTGDYSKIRIHGFIKNLISSYDHRSAKKSINEKTARTVNEKTNIRIADLLLGS